MAAVEFIAGKPADQWRGRLFDEVQRGGARSTNDRVFNGRLFTLSAWPR